MAQKQATNARAFTYNLFADKRIYSGNIKGKNDTQYNAKTKLNKPARANSF